MKSGDFVYCLGEGDDIFAIRQMANNCAWLECRYSIGWKSMDDLTKVKPKEVKARINKLVDELKFLTC